MMENRIEPWEERMSSFTQYSDPRLPETKGTLVWYNGILLRARGDYSNDLAGALITSHNHMQAEGMIDTGP